MEDIFNQILYGSMLENWSVVDSLMKELMKNKESASTLKELNEFLHSKNDVSIETLVETFKIVSENKECLEKSKIFIENYKYFGECSRINSETNILKIKTHLEKVEDPILINLFSTRISKSVKEISDHYEKASFLLKEKGFEKISSQAFAWHLKWKSDETKNGKKSANYDINAAECFKKSGENKLYHDALGLANIKLMSSTTNLEEQINYSRIASKHFKKAGNVEVFRMKDLRRKNAVILFEFAKTKDSLLEAAKYYKEAANEFKIGDDIVFYHRTMALYYKCQLISAKDWDDKAKIFEKIAFHNKKGNDVKKYFEALGDKYNSLSRTKINLQKIAKNLKKASSNYQKAGDNLRYHQTLGSYYQTKAVISKNGKEMNDFYLKAAEEFKKGNNMPNYHNVIGYAKIFNINNLNNAEPKLWKEIAENFDKGNSKEMYLLSMHNYYFSEFHLAKDIKKRAFFKDNFIKLLKEFIDYSDKKDIRSNVDEFLISKTGIDTKILKALYKGRYYRFLADFENELEKKKENYQKAIVFFSSILKECPNNLALRELGWIFYKIGYFDGSLEVFKEAMKLDPDDESIKIEFEIVEKALISDYVKTKEDYEKEKEARIRFEEQSYKLTDILYRQPPSFHKDSFMDRILRVLFDAGRNFEKRYKTFAKLTEPELRDILVSFLNNEFKDEATGETIQGEGKTDIHIKNPDDHREIMIVECKKWRGEKQYLEGFLQKKGYLTGREKKSILLTFSDKIHFSEISHKAKEAIEKDENYIQNSIEDLESGSNIHEANFVSEHKLGIDIKIKVYNIFFNLGFSSSCEEV